MIATRPTAAQIERARHLLAHEGAVCSVAAGRVLDKLNAHLDPLIGSAGVQALLIRSRTLVRVEFAFLEGASVESSTGLRACLEAQEPGVARESAVALFGTFFALISTFIGERLTTQVLRSAWPTIDEGETRK